MYLENIPTAKGEGAALKSYLLDTVDKADVYYASNKSYLGFKEEKLSEIIVKRCETTPTLVISPDGQDIAIYAKDCPHNKERDFEYICVYRESGTVPTNAGVRNRIFMLSSLAVNDTNSKCDGGK